MNTEENSGSITQRQVYGPYIVVAYLTLLV